MAEATPQEIVRVLCCTGQGPRCQPRYR